MRPPIDLTLDVTAAAALGGPAHIAATLFLPDEGAIADPPLICFAFPGGGYGRRYYDFDMPGARGGGQAGFHAARGWIVVAIDHLGFGQSTVADAGALDLDNIAAANHAAVGEVMARLEAGTLAEGLGALRGATKLGIGQSMGGCFTVVAQGQHETFDGIAVLGFSAIHTVVPTRPGSSAAVWPWIARHGPLANPRILNAAAAAAAEGAALGDAGSIEAAARSGEHPFQWAFHHDDEPADIVALDMAASAGTADPLPAWRSATTPACGVYMVAPGAVALEAAAIRVPVLVAVGERDVVPDLRREPQAYLSAPDIALFQCERMAHMHNFAPTRTRLWQRIHSWGTGIAALRAGGES